MIKIQGFKHIDEFIDGQESKLLFEMPNVHHWEKFGKMIGIPMNIWLDHDKAYIRGRHSKRTKFQKDKGHQMTEERHLISIALSDYKLYKGSKEIDIDNLPKGKDGFEVDKEDINKVISFIEKHKIEVDLLADEEISFKQFEDIIENDQVIKKYDGQPMIGDIYQHTEKTQIKVISVSDSKIVAKELKAGGVNLYFLRRKGSDEYIKEGTKGSGLGTPMGGSDYTLTKSKEYMICSK